MTAGATGRLSRRAFLGFGVGAAAGAVLAGCGGGGGPGRPRALTGPRAPVDATEDAAVTLRWAAPTAARAFDVELNGVTVAGALSERSLHLGAGDGDTGLLEGANVWRVRTHGAGDGGWSERATFAVRPVAPLRVRGFDFEDDGPIDLTTRGAAADLVVGARYAHGRGKGVALRAADPAATAGFKNEAQQPIDECWLRLSVRLVRAGRDGATVNLARIHASGPKVSEHLVWVTGRGLELSSRPGERVRVAPRTWVQVQLGVRADGTVELWLFDGTRERLVARGARPDLTGPTKDTVSIGNDSPRSDTTFEVWLDDLAVAERRLPWVRPNATPRLVRPSRLDPKALPPTFSFVFGSCNNPKQIPYRTTALGAAADTEPDFVVHLGDLDYPDSNAYTQTKAGYLALWSDLTHEAQMARLITRPWIYIASDHDLGGNDVDAKSLNPRASAAFAAWQHNDPSADGVGRYGSLPLDRGRVLLVWTEGIAYRSPKTAPDGPRKIVLGAKQKAWLLDALAHTKARLVILASQTALSHVSNSDWAAYGFERAEVIRACQSSPAIVRIISGDYHHALWGRFGPRVAEWTAAPLAEFAEPVPPVGTLVDAAAEADVGPGFGSRPRALAGETVAQFDAATSFGRVVVDTRAATATFEVRDSAGKLRVDPAKGVTFREVVQYA